MISRNQREGRYKGFATQQSGQRGHIRSHWYAANRAPSALVAFTVVRTRADRLAWGDGPWRTEPDRRHWQDAATGYPCRIVRNSMGALCGYVGVSEGHPLYGHEDYFSLPLSSHGGVNFSGARHPETGQPGTTWWFGFDCGHCFDLVPGLEATMRKYNIAGYVSNGVYRDFAYVEAQVAALATQLWRADHGVAVLA